MGSRRPPRWARALPLLGAWLLGCEALVGGRLATVYCGVEGAVGPPSCPVGLACLGGVCEAVAALPETLGLACATDGDCVAGELCLDPARYGGAGPLRCSRPCCTSADCGAGSTLACWPSAAGSFCRPGADLGRAGVGQAEPGAACSVAADCRSGLCACASPGCVTPRCLDACCSDTDCAGAAGSGCAVAVPGGPLAGRWACGAEAPGAGAEYAPCVSPASCASGLCLELAGARRCAPPCCSSASCGSIPGDRHLIACAEVSSLGAVVRACALALPATSTGAVGEACTLDAQCRGGRCVMDSPGKPPYCTDVCCTDGDCGDPATVACRPHDAGTSWALRCEPR